MRFWRFFWGSENPSVLMRTRIFRFSEKLKKAQITSQISLLTKQTLFIHLFVFCSFAPFPQKYKSIFWGPHFHDFSSSAEKAKYRELSPF